MQTTTQLRMARQPIFDRKGKVEAFELLYREAQGCDAAGGDGFIRTAKSVEALFELGLERLVGDVRAYLNLDFSFMDMPVLEIFPVMSTSRLGRSCALTSRPTRKVSL